MSELQGWGDVSWNNPEVAMATPFLQALADEGLILDHHYVHPFCSPSRAAFMTGYYSTHTNVQR